MSLLSLFEPVKELISFDKQTVDNVVFRLHSKVTVVILLAFSLVVTGTQYFGNPIDCIAEDVPPNVMSTYCWIHSTFTLPRRITDKSHDKNEDAHPGVGAQYYGEETTTHHYYQWVCFTLFFQALLFYMPRMLWLGWEGGRVKRVVPNELVYNVTDARMPAFPMPRGVVKEEVIRDRVNAMHHFMSHQIGRPGHSAYYFKFQICEWLNLLNVIFQIVLADIFLGGMFSTYGSSVWAISNMDPADRTDPMDLVFPKVAKCTFRKHGPSGTIQNYDGLCVLPINIINEKIYVFLWFWFVFLAVVTAMTLVYRLLTLFSKSARRNALRARAQMLVDSALVNRIIDRVRHSDWFFLTLLGANIDPHIFSQLLIQLDKHLVHNKSLNGNLAPEKVEKIA